MNAVEESVIGDTTPQSQPMPEQHTPQRSELKEQFDENGDVLTVGNLTFVEGILGTGSYGTVRLAHRRPLTPPLTSPYSVDHKKRIRDTHEFSRSASAPTDSTFFRRPDRLEKSPSSKVGDLFASPFKKEKNYDMVAVKIFNKSLLKRMRTMERDKATNRMQIKTAYEKVEREIALMKKFSHPNLVALIDAIDSPESGNLYMVLEYMPLGEILTYQDNGSFRRSTPKSGQLSVEGVVDGHFDEEHAALYFVDILHALAYLHQHHICHRDLKPENILLDARGIVKISDFGVSHFFEEDQDIGAQRLAHAQQHHPTKLTRTDTDSALQMAGMADTGFLTKTEGTWCFWSPEMCSSSNFFSGYASDMWAAGVCLYIFVTGKLPFFSEVPTELFDMIAQADVPYQGHGLSNSLLDLLKVTLEKDPTKRAGVGDCLKHPFLQVARTKRIRQLSAEFRESRSRTLVVGEEDIRRAFRIVTTMVNPAEFLKNAQKQIKGGLQAARERLSMGGSTFSSSSSLDHDTPTIRSRKAPVRNGNPMHAALYQRGSLSSFCSFGSSESESEEHVSGASSGKLFPIPQDRVMTESSRNRNESIGSDESSLFVTESKTHDSYEDDGIEVVSQSQSALEKRASDVSVQPATVKNKKRTKLRRNESKEACCIQ